MLEVSTRLGPYEIIAPLGAGGMGEVYRARDTRLGREVAIKVLPEAFAANPDRQGRFEREARAVAALSHPNILAIHDYGTQGGVTYAVMELLEGETLRKRLAKGPRTSKALARLFRSKTEVVTCPSSASSPPIVRPQRRPCASRPSGQDADAAALCDCQPSLWEYARCESRRDCTR
jgi:serine/threonine protein kinase